MATTTFLFFWFGGFWFRQIKEKVLFFGGEIDRENFKFLLFICLFGGFNDIGVYWVTVWWTRTGILAAGLISNGSLTWDVNQPKRNKKRKFLFQEEKIKWTGFFFFHLPFEVRRYFVFLSCARVINQPEAVGPKTGQGSKMNEVVFPPSTWPLLGSSTRFIQSFFPLSKKKSKRESFGRQSLLQPSDGQQNNNNNNNICRFGFPTNTKE